MHNFLLIITFYSWDASYLQSHSRLPDFSANIRKFVGVPEGNYESVLFKTAFEKKSETAERVILIKQSIGWRVIDYRIY